MVDKYKLVLILLGFWVLVPSCSSNEDQNSDVEFIDLRIMEIGSTSALIHFQTSRETTCEIEYGTSANKLDQTQTNPMMNQSDPFVIDHEVVLEELKPDSVYYFKAKVEDPEGNVYRSTLNQFTTLDASTVTSKNNVAHYDAGTRVIEISSNYGGMGLDSTWGGNKAIDGETSTEWATNQDGDEAYIVLDFGQDRQLTGFGFQSRKMAGGSSIIQRVRLVFDGEIELGPYDTPDPDQFYQFDFESMITAKTVRIESMISTGGNTGAKEIQFFSAL